MLNVDRRYHSLIGFSFSFFLLLTHPTDPSITFVSSLQVINHLITVEDLRGPDQKKTACYDIDVEVDDTLKAQMNSFLLSTASQQEIQSLDNKIHETVDTIQVRKGFCQLKSWVDSNFQHDAVPFKCRTRAFNATKYLEATQH